MGIMVYSLLWVMQDLYHQPYDYKSFIAPSLVLRLGWLRGFRFRGRGFRVSGFRTSGYEGNSFICN